jgi:hypothetical protein
MSLLASCFGTDAYRNDVAFVAQMLRHRYEPESGYTESQLIGILPDRRGSRESAPGMAALI